MKILITGGSGLIGRALSKELRAQGHTVVAAVRREPKADGEIRWDPKAGTIDPAAFDGTDAVIHLAGAGIGDKRWTAAYKRELLESRTLGTRTLALAMASAPHKPSVFLSGSAIGYYGARGDEQLDENARPGDVVHMTRGSVSAWLGHVAIVERVEGDRLVTIEGNTNGKGSATGGGVLRHTRPVAAWNLGVWRPPYKAEKIRLLLRLPDGRLCAWQGDMAGSARKVTWVPTITAAEQLLAAGYRQTDYDGPVVLT